MGINYRGGGGEKKSKKMASKSENPEIQKSPRAEKSLGEKITRSLRGSNIGDFFGGGFGKKKGGKKGGEKKRKEKKKKGEYKAFFPFPPHSSPDEGARRGLVGIIHLLWYDFSFFLLDPGTLFPQNPALSNAPQKNNPPASPLPSSLWDKKGSLEPGAP